MKIIKKVVEIGNGAAVYVPKEYLGMEITLTLPEGLSDLKKRILDSLSPCMDNIVGVYLFGSYARGESSLLSDIDVMIVTKEEARDLKKVLEDIDVRVLTLEKLRKSIENFPAMILPLLKESKTIVNPVLLEELQNSRINYKNLKWNFDEIKRTLKLIETFIEIDDEDISISHIYSLVMRARLCYMIETLLKGSKYSNTGLISALAKRGLSKEKYADYYSVYRRVRDGEEIAGNINKEEIGYFINIVREYLEDLENQTRKKIAKGN